MGFKDKLSSIFSLSAATLALINPAAAGSPSLPPLVVDKRQTISAPQDSTVEKLVLQPPQHDKTMLFAAHRSHASHASHRSHYSGTGAASPGYLPAPQPGVSRQGARQGIVSESLAEQPTTQRYQVAPPVQKPVAVPQTPVVIYTNTTQKSDVTLKVVEWQKKRASEGSATAQYDLALRYLEGDGVEKSLERAKVLLELAAAQGNSQAATKLKELSPQK